MKRVRLQFFVLAIAFMAVLSCEKDTVSPDGENENAEAGIEEIPDDPNLVVFSASLARAFKDHEGLRAFVKERALQQFDKDYDVLYQMVKDEMVGGASFRDLLLQSGISGEELQAVESEFPLLTIYVPDLSNLPEKPFSAKLWNTADQVPAVALAVGNQSAKTSVYFGEGGLLSLKPGQIPIFPVVALKINERVVTSETISPRTGKAPGKELKFHSGDRFSFSFIDKAYDGLNPSSEEKGNNAGMTARSDVDPALISAYNVYAYSGIPFPGIAQRDNIYYGLDRGNVNGDLNTQWAEYITELDLDPDNNDPLGAYLSISDNRLGITGDPSFRSPKYRGWRTWTEGNFEFRFITGYNSSIYGPQYSTTTISVPPEDLFRVEYGETIIEQQCVWIVINGVSEFKCTDVFLKKVESISSKKYKFPGKGARLLAWDLSHISTRMYVYVYEDDIFYSDGTRWTHDVTLANATNFTTKPKGRKLGYAIKTISKDVQLRWTTWDQRTDFIGWTYMDYYVGPVLRPRDLGGAYKYLEYELLGQRKVLMTIIPRLD